MTWIPATEAMPDEHESVFEKLRKKNKLPEELLRMHKQESDSVIVTVEFEDGSKAVMTAKTKDGKWDTGYKIEGQTVIAWMPFPEPWEKELPECCEACYYHSVRPSAILGLVDECDLGKHRMEERDGNWWYGGEGRPKACPLETK